jgi:hypothetical protein
MNITVNFLLQATRVLQVGNYDETELEMVYNFIVNLDNFILILYNRTYTLPTYKSDLELYNEIVDELIKIFIEREEYEKCGQLKEKKDQSLKIMNLKTN